MTSAAAATAASPLAGSAPAPRTAPAVLAVFTASVFTSAFLLFLVQPLFGRMALPRLGGSPAVWNTCMLFFQAALLAGYLYAHVSSRVLQVRAQVLVHLGLLACAAVVLPIALGTRAPAPDAQPVLWLLAVMAATVGPPFAVLSGTGPLLQRWFAYSGHRYAGDPYPLYAASNLGSTAALLAYPALVEPSLRLAEQSLAWTAGYALLAGLVLGCGLMLRGAPGVAHASVTSVAAPAPGVAERIRWVAFAFVPSSMLLGVTTYLTTDLAPVPLLWVLPLSLYLLTFTLAFARRPLLPQSLMVQLQPALLVGVAVILLQTGGGLVRRPALGVALHLAGLFVTAMVCHGELARRRPHVAHLTEFYLWISVGGVLGGIFNVLVAPMAFSTLLEYPLVVVLAALARPRPAGASRGPRALRPAAAAVVAAAALAWATGQASGLTTPVALGAAALGVAVATLGLSQAPVWLALALGGFLGVRALDDARQDGTLLATRSFFGTYRVSRAETATGTYHRLTHGSTLHGAQNRDPAQRRTPLTYYLRRGPVGQLFASLRAPAGERRVAVIGLGTGSAAAYAVPGDRWTYYEIDPGIERIARDTALFTFLAQAGGPMPVVLGDARLRLAEAPRASYDLIVLDAFTSDAVPTHLLTREALELYLEKLAPGGVLAYHLSNRYLELEAVVAALARERGLASRVGSGPVARAEHLEELATWVVLARSEADLGALATHAGWQPLTSARRIRAWTDDYSSVLQVMRW